MLVVFILIIIAILFLANVPNKEYFHNSRLYLLDRLVVLAREKTLLLEQDQLIMLLWVNQLNVLIVNVKWYKNGTPNLANLTAPTKCFSCEGELL